MGRTPCCDKTNVKKGPWSPEEDAKLKDYIDNHGTGGNWISLPQKAGLKRCGKSCRLRWLNYLRPDIKHGDFSEEEDRIICNLFATIGSRWSVIAAQLPGRTDNDIKNYWNTKLKKKLMGTNSVPKNPHHPTISSFLQPSSTSSSSSSPSSYSDSNHTGYPQPPTWSFSSFEPISFSANLLNASSSSTFSTNAAPIHQLAQESFVNPMIQNYHVKDSLLAFGGEGSCCSSSDGSCSNHYISKGGDAEYGGRGESNQVGRQNYSYHVVEGNRKITFTDCCSVNGWNEKQDGLWTETPLDYGLEEIKQLISSSTSCSNIFFDETS